MVTIYVHKLDKDQISHPTIRDRQLILTSLPETGSMNGIASMSCQARPPRFEPPLVDLRHQWGKGEHIMHLYISQTLGPPVQ